MDYSLVVYKGFCNVPGVMLKYLKAKKPWRSERQRFVEFYETDLPNNEGLGAELEMWEVRWLRESSLEKCTIPDKISETLFLLIKISTLILMLF